MRHPLAADHELVFDVAPEGVGQAAVPAGQPDAALHRLLQALLLLGSDRGHGERLDDQVERLHLGGVEIGVERVGDLDLKALLLEQRREDIHALLRLVTFPAAPDDQRLLFRGLPGRPRRGPRGEQKHGRRRYREYWTKDSELSGACSHEMLLTLVDSFHLLSILKSYVKFALPTIPLITPTPSPNRGGIGFCSSQWSLKIHQKANGMRLRHMACPNCPWLRAVKRVMDGIPRTASCRLPG